MTDLTEPEPGSLAPIPADAAEPGLAAPEASPGGGPPPVPPAAKPVPPASAPAAAEPGSPGSAPAPVEPAAAAARPAVPSAPRRGWRLTVLVTLIVLGLVGVAGGGIALAREMTRAATKAEVAAALSEEIATRWQRLPAGTIFPSTITYQNAEGHNATATLVGIAPRSTCRATLGVSGEQAIRSLDCTTMLRATYTGGNGALAATVGIGVLPSASAAGKALSDLEPMHPAAGLDAVPYSGTIAGTFTNPARASSGVQIAGPYIFLYTAGYTDGMPGAAAAASSEPASLGTGILTVLEKTLTSHHGNPCAMKDISC